MSAEPYPLCFRAVLLHPSSHLVIPAGSHLLRFQNALKSQFQASFFKFFLLIDFYILSDIRYPYMDFTATLIWL